MRVVILTSMRTSMRTMWVVVPPGVKPGGLFQIQTPRGDVLQVTCPPGASAGQQIPVVVPAPVQVVVPPGVEPGGLFQIQTPSGDMLQVTCPRGASAGQWIPVAVPARAGSVVHEVVVPPGVEPGGFLQIQTPGGDMLQVTCPPGASAGQRIPVVVPARAGSEAAPPVPAQMERMQASEPGLYSVANMTGTWEATHGDCCCCTCYECACYDCYECTGHKLWVRTPYVSTGLGTSFSTSSLDSMCNRDAHGHVPTFCVDDGRDYTQDNGEPRIYERTAGTNTFRCGEHTAILLGPRKMTVDGTVYHWGKWARQEFSDYSSGYVV